MGAGKGGKREWKIEKHTNKEIVRVRDVVIG